MSFQDIPIALACASTEPIFFTGDTGPVWRVVEGLVRLEREAGSVRQVVHLAGPGDLIGVESLCDQSYQFSATAFTDCRLELVPQLGEATRESLLAQALLQHQYRSQDMANLRTGSVSQRVTHLLRLMRIDLPFGGSVQDASGDAVRKAMPALRDIAQVVDAKAETVCRALTLLLPPRQRKPGPQRMKRPVPVARPVVRSPGWAANASLFGATA